GPRSRAASAAGPTAPTWPRRARTPGCAGGARPCFAPPAAAPGAEPTDGAPAWVGPRLRPQLELGLARVAALEILDQAAEGVGLAAQRHAVGVDLQHLALPPRPLHPVVVGPVEARDVVDADPLLAGPAAAGDALHEGPGRRLEVDDQVGP